MTKQEDICKHVAASQTPDKSHVSALESKSPLREQEGTAENSKSTLIKFTTQEVDKMSKSFKKEFIVNGMVAHITKRPSGKNSCVYEIRYRRNGFDISVSSANLMVAKAKFIEAAKNPFKKEYRAKKKRDISFGKIAEEWLSYKQGKITEKCWKSYKAMVETKFDDEWKSTDITEIHTSDLDEFMRQFSDKPRAYEDMRTIFSSIFKYAVASGVIQHNPLLLIPFKRAERTSREALTEKQIKTFLERLKDVKFDEIRQSAYAIYFFGLRPSELDADAHFENGFLIARNRKRKGGKIEYKKIPIHPQAKSLIDLNKPIKMPFEYSKFARLMKEALGEDGLTSYNLRHTFATLCAEKVREEVVDIWMGDSPERLIGKFYIHYTDEFMKQQMERVKFIV